MIVEVLIEPINELLDEVELAAPPLHLDELVVELVIVLRLRARPLHREMEHQDRHIEHVLVLLSHSIFPTQNFARLDNRVSRIDLRWIKRIWILRVVKYL